jgi:hypothetical protein
MPKKISWRKEVLKNQKLKHEDSDKNTVFSLPKYRIDLIYFSDPLVQ